MSALVPISTAGVLLDLDTGEQVALADATDEQIAVWIDRISELQSVAKERRAEANRELVGRMDRSARWTINAGGWKVSAPSPAPDTQWEDPAGLWRELVELDDLSVDAVDAAVESEVVWRVRAAGINALRKLGRLDVNRVIDAHERKVPRENRSVRVRAA
jgi:hypothetical protein